MKRSVILPVLLVCVAGAGRAIGQCQPPTGYYSSIDQRSPEALRRTLHARIEHHRRVPWSGTWAVLESADEDPRNRSNILDVYKNASYPKVGRGNQNYNREHSWPKSLGFASSSSANYPESDCHALFLCDVSYNSARGNKAYRNLQRTAQEFASLGGGTGRYPGNSCWTTGFGVRGAWETWFGRRGDVARALLYLDVRYDGSRHRGGASEPDLVLTDDYKLIVQSQSQSNLSVAYMGFLSVLLQWHQQDPPDAKECRRNAAVALAQGNRNPFIDHPEWATLLFRRDGRELQRPWINELHYDNAGADVGEMVEIAGPVGFDLRGWQVVGYNGSGGGVYDRIDLDGVLPAATGCLSARAFAFVGMQNGPREGLALVDPNNRVVEFLSYEGVLTAVDGPAVGMVSVDIGVFESSATPVGHSLQKAGAGKIAPDFTWRVPAASTPGVVNRQQSFVGGCGTAVAFGCGLNPFGSILLLSGTPSIGSTFAIGIDNPRATQAPGSATIVFLASAGSPVYPCGFALPGFGMRDPSVPGELLLNPAGVLVVPAPAWNGKPSRAALPVPNDAKLVGSHVFAQGAIVDPRATNGILIGITEGMRVRLDR